jgi:hypothetical protein
VFFVLGDREPTYLNRALNRTLYEL